MEKDLDYYMGLPYTIELSQDPEAGWFVAIKELPGCMSEGDTPEEAVEMIQDAMRGWIEISLEDKDPIPEPRDLDDYSGKFVVRVPRSLHRQLVEASAEDGVSLNQYINVALAQAVARRVVTRPRVGPQHDDSAPDFTFQRYVPGQESTRAGHLVQEKAGSYTGGPEKTGEPQGAEPAQDAD